VLSREKLSELGELGPLPSFFHLSIQIRVTRNAFKQPAYAQLPRTTAP